jgi:hypothetical protein
VAFVEQTNIRFNLQGNKNNFFKFLINFFFKKKKKKNKNKKPKKEMHLIVQYYKDKNEQRDAENQLCLRRNLDHPFVTRVHVLLETQTELPLEFQNHPKCEWLHFSDHRLTFKEAWQYITPLLKNGEIAAVLNSDIILDETSPWEKLHKYFDQNPGRIAMALSRHEYDTQRTWKDIIAFVGWSQDMWILKKTSDVLVPPPMLCMLDFCVGGAPQCDNVYTLIARDHGGFQVINPGNIFRIFHMDRCRGHSAGTMILNAQTDHRASILFKKLIQGPMGYKENVCPYVDWERALEMHNQGTLDTTTINILGNCCVKGDHVHELFPPFAIAFPNQKDSLQEAWEAMEHVPHVNEKNELGRVMFEFMVEKSLFFEPQCQGWHLLPDSVHMICHWVNHLRHKNQWDQCARLLRLAHDTENVCSRKDAYEYMRYHFAGIVGFYVKDYAWGKASVQKAIAAKNLTIDHQNATFYPLK